MNILYLDDDAEVVRLAVNKLTQQKHTVHAVHTIAEAMQTLKTEKTLDLFLADPHLPCGNCMDLLMGLKTEYEKVKFCVISQSVSRAESNQLKMSEIPFYQKPVLLNKIVETFRKVPPGVTIRGRKKPPLAL